MNPALQHYERLYGARPQRKLDRGSLPPPARYLAEHGLATGKPRSEWQAIRCPAHKGGAEAHASMNVSMVDGHFRCHVCGAKGGDILALHRLRTGFGFAEAVRDLGGRFE